MSLHKAPSCQARCSAEANLLFHLVGGYNDMKREAALYCYHVGKNMWAEFSAMEVTLQIWETCYVVGNIYIYIYIF